MNKDKKVGNKRFTVYDSEANTALELLRELGTFTNEVCDELDNKTDLYGDHKGSWQGLNRPTMSEEGMRATVEKIDEVEMPKIKEEINKKVEYTDLRIFKPSFGYNALGRPSSDVTSTTGQENMLKSMLDIGVDEFSYCIKIAERSNGTMYIDEDIELINFTLDYCKKNNIKISKVHLYVDQEKQTITGNFNTEYKRMVEEVMEMFKEVDYKYFVVWNEATTRIKGSTVCNTILECIDYVKSKGKKVGIALMGLSPFGYLDKRLYEKSDFIGFNYYQPISSKYANTTLQDGVNAWEESILIDFLNTVKSMYPNKELLITESGLCGSYECLATPSIPPTDWQTYDFNGKVCEIYFNGLFNCLKNAPISAVYGWFPHDFVKYPIPIKNLINKYFKGGK